MTEEQIKTALNIEGLELQLGETQEYYWARSSIVVDGRQQSRSTRLPKDPSQADIDRVKEVFAAWRKEEQE
jgi:hypothetical protein